MELAIDKSKVADRNKNILRSLNAGILKTRYQINVFPNSESTRIRGKVAH